MWPRPRWARWTPQLCATARSVSSPPCPLGRASCRSFLADLSPGSGRALPPPQLPRLSGARRRCGRVGVRRTRSMSRWPGVGRIAADCAPPVVHDQHDAQRHQQPEHDTRLGGQHPSQWILGARLRVGAQRKEQVVGKQHPRGNPADHHGNKYHLNPRRVVSTRMPHAPASDHTPMLRVNRCHQRSRSSSRPGSIPTAPPSAQNSLVMPSRTPPAATMRASGSCSWQPHQSVDAVLGGRQAPGEPTGSHRELGEPRVQLPPGDPTAIDEVLAGGLFAPPLDGMVAARGVAFLASDGSWSVGAAQPLVSTSRLGPRRVGWHALVREGGANEESDCGRRGGCGVECRSDRPGGSC